VCGESEEEQGYYDLVSLSLILHICEAVTMNFDDDTNPFAPPEVIPDETWEKRYDLYKIARYYNRIRWFLIWWIPLFILLLLLFLTICLFLFMYIGGPEPISTEEPVELFFIGIMVWIIVPLHLLLTLLTCYGVFLVFQLARFLKYRIYSLFWAIGACTFLLNIFICSMLRKRAKNVLIASGVNVTGPKIDLYQFKREQEY